MSLWHAYANRDALERGTDVLLTGGHEAVRLQTADQISIEMPDRNRLSVVVVDRTDSQLLVAVGSGPLVRLTVSTGVDMFADFELSDGLSRQNWTVQ